jgi:hypothetical protein
MLMWMLLMPKVIRRILASLSEQYVSLLIKGEMQFLDKKLQLRTIMAKKKNNNKVQIIQSYKHVIVLM